MRWGALALLGVVACGGGGGGGVDGAGGDDAPTADAFSSTPGLVQTESGWVRGELTTDELAIYRGIPYAAPPTGARRWRLPEAAEAWDAIRETTAFGPACPQNQAVPQSEDCLTLNIWAHDDSGGSRPPPLRSVIVWIHGGGYVEGSGSLNWYDGASLARNTGAVVVSINYRLGVLGFLASSELEAEQGAAGNWGLADMIFALGWVQRNIGRFGGDPDLVMIAGESAGGAAVCTLLGAPGAQGLFSSAVVQSGPCTIVGRPDVGVHGLPPARDAADAFAAQLGCAGAPDLLACERAASVDDVLLAYAHVPVALPFWFGLPPIVPVVDGRVLDADPLDAIAAGRGDVRVIVGANDDEGTAFMSTFPDDPTYLHDVAVAFYGPTFADQLLAAYDPDTLGGARAAAIRIASDLGFTCQAEALARASAAHGAAPAFLYRWSRAMPSGPFATLGATHGTDIFYLFDTLPVAGVAAPSADDRAVVALVQRAWSEHATGETSSPFRGEPAWPAATATTGPFFRIDVTPSVETTWRDGRCDTLRALGLAP